MADPRTLGPYTLLDVIGQCGMGRVYRARQEGLERDVALKVVIEGKAADPEAVTRFEREARALARVGNPHVVRILDCGVEDDLLWLAMELLEGGTLKDRLGAGDSLPVLEAVGIVRDLCRGLAAVHEAGVVHRDVKPPNVMITRDGTVKLMDFGPRLLNEEPTGLAIHYDHQSIAVGSDPIRLERLVIMGGE